MPKFSFKKCYLLKDQSLHIWVPLCVSLLRNKQTALLWQVGSLGLGPPVRLLFHAVTPPSAGRLDVCIKGR